MSSATTICPRCKATYDFPADGQFTTAGSTEPIRITASDGTVVHECTTLS